MMSQKLNFTPPSPLCQRMNLSTNKIEKYRHLIVLLYVSNYPENYDKFFVLYYGVDGIANCFRFNWIPILIIYISRYVWWEKRLKWPKFQGFLHFCTKKDFFWFKKEVGHENMLLIFSVEQLHIITLFFLFLKLVCKNKKSKILKKIIII